jgi:predicted RNase H-like nuclease (RuvC/YqgF family)
MDADFYSRVVDAAVAELEKVGWHSSALELPRDIESILRELAARDKEVDRLTAERDALAGQLAQVREHAEVLATELAVEQANVAREKARREYDSVDAYNARINEAVRHLREQEERGIR